MSSLPLDVSAANGAEGCSNSPISALDKNDGSWGIIAVPLTLVTLPACAGSICSTPLAVESAVRIR